MRRAVSAAALALVLLVGQPAGAHRRPAPTPSPTLTPIPVPTRMSEALRVERLRLTVARLATAEPGRLGVAIVDITRETRISARGDVAFPLGDVKKLAIALVVYRRADQHLVDLDAYVPLTPRDRARGTIERTYARSLVAMLAQNDAVATADVLDAIGGPSSVQQVLDRLGIRDFDVLHARATPNGVAALLAGIAQERYAKFDSTDEFLELLASVPSAPDRLRSGLPAGTPFAHLAGTSSDAGIVTLADGRRIAIAAFLDQTRGTPAEDDATFVQLAQAVVAAYAP